MQKLNKMLIVIIGLLLIISCQNNEFLTQPINVEDDIEATSDGEQIVLGKQIENPYSVENMKIALENLQNESDDVSLKSSSVDEFEIYSTHLYVRFLPKDSLQMELLDNDSTLELFDYPLDYEIEQEGQYYHDPEIPENQCTWLYTAVPVDYVFPNVEYEIIEECFIPDEEDDEMTLKGASIDENFLMALEDEAFRITGNLDEPEEGTSDSQSTPSLRRSKREPKGTFQVLNTFTHRYEGIRHVKVRAHRIVKIKSDYTDDDGDYHIKKGFRRDVHLSIIFENDNGFKIWGNRAFFAPAKHNEGWESKYGKSRDFDRNSAVWKWATVNNAVDKYRDYCDEYSFKKPPSGLRVWVFDKNKDGVTGSASMMRRTWGWFGYHPSSNFNTFFNYVCGLNVTGTIGGNLFKFVMPDITVSFEADDHAQTSKIYQTVFHECAHASHWSKVGSSYWYRYVNYIITYGSKDNPYASGTGKNAGYCGVGEMWGNYIGALLYRDEFDIESWWHLADDEDWYNPGFLRLVDDIDDITTAEIFACLDAITIDEFVEELKTKTVNDDDIDEAYELYTDWP